MASINFKYQWVHRSLRIKILACATAFAFIACEKASEQRISFDESEIEAAKIEAQQAVDQKKAQYAAEVEGLEANSTEDVSAKTKEEKERVYSQLQELSFVYHEGKLMLLPSGLKEGEQYDPIQLIDAQDMKLPDIWFFAHSKSEVSHANPQTCDSEKAKYFGSLQELSEFSFPANTEMSVLVCSGKSLGSLEPLGLPPKMLVTAPQVPEISFVEPDAAANEASLALKLGENQREDVKISLIIEEKSDEAFKQVGFVDFSKSGEFAVSEEPVFADMTPVTDLKAIDPDSTFGTVDLSLVQGDRYRFRAVLQNKFKQESAPSEPFEFIYNDVLTEDDLFAAGDRGFKNLSEPIEKPLAITSDQEKIAKKLDQLDTEEKESIIKELESDYVGLRSEIKKASEAGKATVVIDGETVSLVEAKEQLELNREKVSLLEESKVLETQIKTIAEKKKAAGATETEVKVENAADPIESLEIVSEATAEIGEATNGPKDKVVEATSLSETTPVSSEKSPQTPEIALESKEGANSKEAVQNQKKKYSEKIAKLKEKMAKINDNFDSKKAKLKDSKQSKKAQLTELNEKIKEAKKNIKAKKKEVKAKIAELNEKIKAQEKEMRSMSKIVKQEGNQQKKALKKLEKKANKTQKSLDKVLAEKEKINSQLNEGAEAEVSTSKLGKLNKKLETLSNKESSLIQELELTRENIEIAKALDTDVKQQKRRDRIETRLVKLHERKSNLKARLEKLDDRKSETLQRLADRKAKIKDRFSQIQENLAKLKENRSGKVEKINTKIKELKDKRKASKVPAH